MATAIKTKPGPFARLSDAGQSVWLDFINREILVGGDLRRMIDDDGLLGMTSNPTIFDKAISHGAAYDDDFTRLVAQGADADAIYYALTSHDVSAALDLFRPVYDSTEGVDGYVSYEVSPLLAHDAKATTAEAKKLWDLTARPNLMVKIPGTT